MTLDQLLALDAIVATGTFRGAAERLNKAQSAVSHQIRKLEDQLQFDLFSRDAYRPRLTAEGEVYYREALRVLEQVRALESAALSLRKRTRTDRAHSHYCDDVVGPHSEFARPHQTNLPDHTYPRCGRNDGRTARATDGR